MLHSESLKNRFLCVHIIVALVFVGGDRQPSAVSISEHGFRKKIPAKENTGGRRPGSIRIV